MKRVTHLSCKRDQIKMTDYMDRRLPHLSGLPQLPEVHHLHVNILKPYCDSSFPLHCTRLPRESGNNACVIFIWRAVVGEGAIKMYHERCANVGLTFS